MSDASSAESGASLRRLLRFVVAFTILYVISDTVAQLLLPYYSPVVQSEGYLAVGTFGYVMTVNFLIRGPLVGFVLLWMPAMSVFMANYSGPGRKARQ